MSADRLRVLAVTSLFPNPTQPHASSFNRQQLAALSEMCELSVWAPVPWFPFAKALAPTSGAGRAALVPCSSQSGALSVEHPRALQVPVLGRAIAGPLYAASLWRRYRRVGRDFDVVLATWAYPDGFAATLCGAARGVPTVVKVHGTDINVVAERPLQRAQLRVVLPRARAVIAVSRPLAERVRGLGVAADRVHVIPNGVDSARFAPGDKGEARRQLGLDEGRELAIYVGNIKREKGVFDLLEAWKAVAAARPWAQLAVIGGGPDAGELATRAARGSVLCIGALAHEEVAVWMRACDVLCLPSWSEGMPNVVVEAHASGRPVVATRVGAIPDLIDPPGGGRIVAPRDSIALADALLAVLAEPVSADDVIAASSPISWHESAARVFEVLREAAE